MRNKPIVFLIFLLLRLSISHAQTQHRLRVLVLDSLTKKTIYNASVSATDKATGQLQLHTSDEKGEVDFVSSANHQHVLRVSYVGFEPVENFLLLSRDTLITIQLKEKNTLLAEVKINGRENLVFKPDRMIYNVNAKTEKGKNLSDILKKIPFVTIVGDHLLIKGNAKFQILQNGLPSTLGIGEIKNMAGARVESIEIITAPSAKYEGQYDNILNIVLNKHDDYSGGVSFVRVGTRNSSIGTTYTRTKEKINTNITFNVSYDKTKSGSTSETKIFRDTLFDIKQHSTSNTTTPSFNTQYQTELTLSKNDYLGLGLNFGIQNNILKSVYSSEISPINLLYDSDNKTRTRSYNIGLNLNYTKKISKTNTLYFSNLFTLNNSHYNLLSTNTNNTFNDINDNKNREFTSQLDDEFEFKKNVKLEIGGKFIYRYYANKPQMIDSLHQSLNFDQKIVAGYASVSKKINKLFLRIGTRLEQTINQYSGTQITQLNALPNIFGSYSPKNSNNYSIFYRRSVTRPNFMLLSTFINRGVSLNETTGNPNLVNSYNDNIKLENDRSFGDNSISISVNYSRGNKLITSERIVDSYLTRTVYGNLSTSNSFGGDASFNAPLFKRKLYLNLSTSLRQITIKGLNETNKGLITNYTAGLSYNPSEKISIDYFANYLENSISLQGKNGNSIFNDLMIRYQIKKSSLLLQFTNPIINKINESAEINAQYLSSSGNNYYLGRTIALGYAYSFGRTKDENNDVSNDKTNKKL